MEVAYAFGNIYNESEGGGSPEQLSGSWVRELSGGYSVPPTSSQRIKETTLRISPASGCGMAIMS